jgi:hypothetical protein
LLAASLPAVIPNLDPRCVVPLRRSLIAHVALPVQQS